MWFIGTQIEHRGEDVKRIPPRVGALHCRQQPKLTKVKHNQQLWSRKFIHIHNYFFNRPHYRLPSLLTCEEHMCSIDYQGLWTCGNSSTGSEKYNYHSPLCQKQKIENSYVYIAFVYLIHYYQNMKTIILLISIIICL